MSEAVFYRSALDRSLTPEVRRLLESCLARAEQIDALAASLPEMLLVNRSRREGREVKLTKAELRTIRSFERDSQKAAAELPSRVAKFRSTSRLLQSALDGERMELQIEEAIFKGGHPEDEAVAQPLLQLRIANIRELKDILSKAQPD